MNTTSAHTAHFAEDASTHVLAIRQVAGGRANVHADVRSAAEGHTGRISILGCDPTWRDSAVPFAAPSRLFSATYGITSTKFGFLNKDQVCRGAA